MKVTVMPHDINRHMDAEEVERYSIGEMPEDVAAEFEQHLLICEACQQSVAKSDTYVASMQRAAAEFRARPRERRTWAARGLVPLLAAAGVVVALLAGLQLMRTGPAAPAFAVSLKATRGAAIEAKAPAGRVLSPKLDLTGLPAAPAYRVEMVDRFGAKVWQGAIEGARIPPPSPGVYFLRLYSPAGELLREYGLEIESR